MTDQPDTRGGGAGTEFTEGFAWAGEDPTKLAEVIEAAFDYRGDVTLMLRSGEEVSGYVANRKNSTSKQADAYLDLFVAATPPRKILYAEVAGISFTGKDTAAGKSWESWVRRWKAKKEAQARGEEVGEIGLFPDPLD